MNFDNNNLYCEFRESWEDEEHKKATYCELRGHLIAPSICKICEKRKQHLKQQEERAKVWGQ